VIRLPPFRLNHYPASSEARRHDGGRDFEHRYLVAGSRYHLWEQGNEEWRGGPDGGTDSGMGSTRARGLVNPGTRGDPPLNR